MLLRRAFNDVATNGAELAGTTHRGVIFAKRTYDARFDLRVWLFSARRATNDGNGRENDIRLTATAAVGFSASGVRVA